MPMSDPEMQGVERNRDGLRIHTKEEAAKILRVKVSWLERRAAARQIPFSMLGGAYRFTDAHLAEIVRLNEQGALSTSTGPESRRRRRRRADHTKPKVDGFVPLRPRRTARGTS